MSFHTDKQTIDDLKIFGRRSDDCVCGIFNRTTTRGGLDILEQMLQNPLDNPQKIAQRINMFRYFQQKNYDFPYPGELFDATEFYISNTDPRSQILAHENSLKRQLNSVVGADTEFQQIRNGIASLLSILQLTRKFLDQLNDAPQVFEPQKELLHEILSRDDLKDIPSNCDSKKLEYQQVVHWDKTLRFNNLDTIRRLLSILYDLDVYCTVAKISRQENLTFPEILTSGDLLLDIQGLRHPMLKNAVSNDIVVEKNSHVIFLTGANMAGKSTFMKSFGIAVYMAHCGFPVAATRMQFSVRSGLFTTINLPDNLNSGYSHFYSEVLRVKKVAREVASGENLVVIFDELFRGTNVKDAYDATVAVMESFSKRPNSIFLISTHIIEAGEYLREKCPSMNFVYLPTIMEGHTPRYTYKLKNGITEDRHGMIIIRNEKILDILLK